MIAVPVLAQSFGFVNPAIAAAAGAAALVPIVVHLLNRRRHKRVVWAAMVFLLAATRQSRRRLFVEQWLLLALRVVLIGLGVAAAGRPFLSSSGGVAGERVRARRVFVLDDSLSMQTRGAGGKTRFEAALERIRQLLPGFGEDDVFNLVMTSAGTRTPSREAFGASAFEDHLRQAHPTHLAADWEAALSAARELTAETSILKANTTVYVVSDFARADWETAEVGGRAMNEARRLAAEVDLALIKAAEPGMSNVAVRRLTVLTPLTATGFPTRIEAEVVNHGVRAVRDVSVHVTDRERRLLTFEFESVSAGGSASQDGFITFREAGTHGLRAELAGAVDAALAADDRAYVSVEVLQRAPVLLVEGEPGANPMDGHAGYVQKALSPADESSVGSGVFEAKVIGDSELAAESLRDYAVVVLCNVGRLPEREWRRLGEYVGEGGGLLVFGGDQVSVEHYNRQGAGSEPALLPGTLGEAVRPSGGEGEWTTMTLAEPVHPLVAEFASLRDSGLFSARVERYLPITSTTPESRVVLKYMTGDPALVVRSVGRGTSAMFTTSANMEWTNFPAKGDFVSVVVEAVSMLCGRPGSHRTVETGSPIVEPIRPQDVDLPVRLTSPSGGTLSGSVAQGSDGSLTFRAGPAADPGIYRFQSGERTLDFAVNVPAQESDPGVTETAVVAGRVGGSARVLEDEAESGAEPGRMAQATELNLTVLLIVLGLLLVEPILAGAASGSRDGAASE
ncbi:MAG: BatA domain-containing protein [Phycisphaerae bacterium]|nr:BatA domain-containing protein [Planctomycetia bacterium]MCL4717350.1 BatA domain-containing protein [Phycisphaerae bacterium]